MLCFLSFGFCDCVAGWVQIDFIVGGFGDLMFTCGFWLWYCYNMGFGCGLSLLVWVCGLGCLGCLE